MPKKISTFIEGLNPSRTILFFGAGSSIPSGAPSVEDIITALSEKFGQRTDSFSLAELAELIQRKHDRRSLITALRGMFQNVRPTGGLLSLPMYDWKSIYTTNYDTLLEDVYKRKELPTKIYSSNFDFTADDNPLSQSVYKLHGSIEKDITDGYATPLILTSSDYRQTNEFREYLYVRLRSDLSEGHLVIIGCSLSDPEIRTLIQKAVELKKAAGGTERITLFMYSADEDRAFLLEQEGIDVVFGSTDEFFFELSKFAHKQNRFDAPTTGFELPLQLRPSTVDVEHASRYLQPHFSRMFNGGAASYADIVADLTFARELPEQIAAQFSATDRFVAVVLGTSGVGKTTACRQLLVELRKQDFLCWELRDEFPLNDEGWFQVARTLQEKNLWGVLFIDDASAQLHEINELLEGLSGLSNPRLKLVLASSRVNWRPRVKSPAIFRHGAEYSLSRLSPEEIDRLLELVDRNVEIKRLVEHTFAGFSDQERRRRLINRCESDMFVCLKNIFASEKFDDIILREYADLPSDYQEVYKIVAALESAGVRVHRQLVLRLLHLDVNALSNMLYNMTDIINEYVVDEKIGVYAWRGRHQVITTIIADYKFGGEDDWERLFDRVIANISPTYDIEIRSIRDMCNMESGIARLTSKSVQNRLLRRMMSAVPGERIPRHRLIRNLIESGEFDPAETEIRLFENDFGVDGPVARYKVNLMVARAVRTKGLLMEDRVAILQRAHELAFQSSRRYPNNVHVLAAFCEVGIEIYKMSKDLSVFNEAIATLRAAEEEIGDPEITRTISKYERRLSGHPIDE